MPGGPSPRKETPGSVKLMINTNTCHRASSWRWEEAARWRESLRPSFLLHCSGLCSQLHELRRKKDMGATRTLGGLDGWCLWFWGLAFGDDKFAGLVFDPMTDNLLQSFFRKSDSMLCCAIPVATLTDGHTLWLTSTRVISF